LADCTPGFEHGHIGGIRPSIGCAGGAVPVIALPFVHPRHVRGVRLRPWGPSVHLEWTESTRGGRAAVGPRPCEVFQ
jgi:hypothetical protein